MKEKDYNPFQGLWVITSTQQKNRHDKWVALKRFYFRDYTWFFCQDSRTGNEGDGYFYNGKMKESSSDSDDHIVGYSFSAKTSELYIDCSDYCEDGYMWACYNDIYQVFANKNTLILYDLAEVGDTLDDYLVRIVLKRDTMKNRLIENIKAVFLPKISYYRSGSLL